MIEEKVGLPRVIVGSKERTLFANRCLRDCSFPTESNVDFTLFANFYGTVEKSHQFKDEALYTDKPWYNRLMNEIREMKVFRRNKKHA